MPVKRCSSSENNEDLNNDLNSEINLNDNNQQSNSSISDDGMLHFFILFVNILSIKYFLFTADCSEDSASARESLPESQCDANNGIKPEITTSEMKFMVIITDV